MMISEARVKTERSSAYLVQLCRHVNEAGQAHPQMETRVEWSEDHGVISFGGGRCTLHADPGVLTLRVEAPDEASLRRVERRVANRLKRFGRSDRLTVTWTPRQGADDLLSGPRPRKGDARMTDPLPYPDTGDETGVGPDSESTTETSRRVKVILIIAVGLFLLFVIVMHLMSGGLRGLHG
jgi:hypothetical protein